MRRERVVLGIIAGVTLVASSSLACAQAGGSSVATRPGPTPGQSSGMPSDLDTTGMGGERSGCVAPPGGTSSATGGEVRTPANAGALQSRRSGDDAHIGSGHAETAPRGSTAAKADGC